jgi:hypothetical protein
MLTAKAMHLRLMVSLSMALALALALRLILKLSPVYPSLRLYLQIQRLCLARTYP